MVLRVAILVFPALAICSGQMAHDGDLASLSLEQFLKLEVVSVRKSPEKLARTPAAVDVITQDDIRRSGATSLPEALRLAPGVHVARVNGSSWAIGMRGFNGIHSNKLLVMIDGRTIFNPVMSGVMWRQQRIMLEDVERIEVIRGPAGSMWGANAVNGVINVITKKAAATQGTLAAVSGGTMDPARASVRYGANRGDTLAWRTWMHREVNGQAWNSEQQPRLDNWRTGHAGLRLDWQPRERDEIEIQGGITALSSELNVIRYPRPMAVTVSPGPGGGRAGFLQGQWTHTSRRGDQSKLQIFGDLQDMNLGPAKLGVKTFDADFQQSISLGRGHNLLVGGGFRANSLETAGTSDLWFEPANRTYLNTNAFVQDEWQIRPDKLVLTLGGKLERYTLAGKAFQPSARLMWTPTPTARQGYWTAVSGAVRTPSHVDYALRYPLGALGTTPIPFKLMVAGNEHIRPEGLRGVEAGARWQLRRKAVVEVAVYHNAYMRLIANQMPFALTPQNLARLMPSPEAGGGSAGALPPRSRLCSSTAGMPPPVAARSRFIGTSTGVGVWRASMARPSGLGAFVQGLTELRRGKCPSTTRSIWRKFAPPGSWAAAGCSTRRFSERARSWGRTGWFWPASRGST